LNPTGGVQKLAGFCSSGGVYEVHSGVRDPELFSPPKSLEPQSIIFKLTSEELSTVQVCARCGFQKEAMILTASRAAERFFWSMVSNWHVWEWP